MVVVRVQGATLNILIVVSPLIVGIVAIIWVERFRVRERKQSQSASPAVLEITQGFFSCRTTGRDDRCFVTSSGDMWLCTHEACKVARSVYVNSDLASQYECDHVKLAKNTDIAGPLATYSPSILSYPCSDSVRANLNDVVSSLPPATPAVVQVSDQVFAVFGLPTASNPLGLRDSMALQKRFLSLIFLRSFLSRFWPLCYLCGLLSLFPLLLRSLIRDKSKIHFVYSHTLVISFVLTIHRLH